LILIDSLIDSIDYRVRTIRQFVDSVGLIL